ncbi:hypothetical protein [Thauera humireducens]
MPVVAVIGAGYAGLACAVELARAGTCDGVRALAHPRRAGARGAL